MSDRTMIEKVARASFACWRQRMIDTGQKPEMEHLDWDDMSDSEQEFAFLHARAAIQAMRAPTTGMRDAYRCDELWRDLNSVQVWHLWIDAALKED